MTTRVPPWRRLFDRVEAAIGRPLEDALDDPRVNEMLVRGLEKSRHGGRRWRGAAAAVLHLYNLPSHSDIRRLERRLGAMEKQLLEISDAVERLAKSIEK